MIYIPGNPLAKSRPRFARRGKFVQTYDTQVKEKKAFKEAFIKAYGKHTPLDEPIKLILRFYMKRPKAHCRTGKYSHLLKPTAPKKHVSKPDIDNLVKFVMDALNGTAWKDDNIICDLVISKRYNIVPGTMIHIHKASLPESAVNSSR